MASISQPASRPDRTEWVSSCQAPQSGRSLLRFTCSYALLCIFVCFIKLGVCVIDERTWLVERVRRCRQRAERWPTSLCASRYSPYADQSSPDTTASTMASLHYCRQYFDVKLPGTLRSDRVRKFEKEFAECDNIFFAKFQSQFSLS